MIVQQHVQSAPMELLAPTLLLQLVLPVKYVSFFLLFIFNNFLICLIRLDNTRIKDSNVLDALLVQSALLL